MCSRAFSDVSEILQQSTALQRDVLEVDKEQILGNPRCIIHNEAGAYVYVSSENPAEVSTL